MAFPVHNHTSLGAENPKLVSLLVEAEREIEAFLAYNPSRRERCFIRVEHYGRGRYVARCKYSDPQGTGSIATVMSATVA